MFYFDLIFDFETDEMDAFPDATAIISACSKYYTPVSSFTILVDLTIISDKTYSLTSKVNKASESND